MATKKTVAKTATATANTAAPKKPVARKPVARKPLAKRAPATKPPAKRAVTKKPATKKPAPKPVPKGAPAKKPSAIRKPSPPTKAATQPTVSRPAAKAAPARKPAAKLAPAKAGRPAPAGPEPKVPAKPPGPEPKPVETPEPKPVRAKVTYTVGDKVVHPQHGAAVIDRKVRQDFGGKMRDYYVLDIATDQLKVFVPVETIGMVIRPVISKNQTRHVFSIFREEPQEAGSNWSRWYKVLNEKMTSGEINQVAEVVRDLTFAQQTKGISPALKRMLSRARLTLISEIRFALDIDEEEATRRLDRSLPKVEQPLPASI